ncbi:TRAP transporter large permease subunit [Allopusillimonas soli]|uniref:TRAP transporter large permease protein n=1 Tax=Allopusillimonas soli TaxID=659016 RepID=A0A853FAA6_9BURK|nr:TRAP transporter large permease subunit [Allopusillimonas soli]NYT37634.1 TRAP transporter large permease subunit [Allopusillimonas soli]TEA74403.1 TRAP transporter large permease subunit [Allopusillimonas soli]
MDPSSIFLVILALFSVLLLVGVPIFAALGVSSILGMVLHGGLDSLNVIPSILHRGLSSYSLICIPLFILMGETMARTSIGGRLYNLFYLWLNRLPGGLAIASVGSAAVFGAMSGVSVAGAATIGRVAIPEMLKRHYDAGLSGGSVAAAGSLALLIPPSIGFVLYGEMADQSIGKLFTAAMLPGLLLTMLMMGYLYILTRIKPNMAPRDGGAASWRIRLRALAEVWAPVLLILLVLGTIYLGVATPTEASGIGALGAFLVALAYRELTLPVAIDIFRSSIVTTGMILLILTSALLFGYIMTRLMIPQMLIAWIADISQPAWVILLLVLAFLLVVGMFLDIVSIILIATPILLPVITGLGFSPIWFGVVMIIACEMAVITPPVGLNLYVIKGIAPEISLNDIIKGALPFVLVEGLAILILSLFPQIALWLPGMM